ncbi:MAG: FAD-dependent oxidoreductase [Promethearchaeota archaeon]
MKFVKLFEPLKIGNLEIQNRIVLPAMALNYTPNGYINEVLTNFYLERAKGGVSLIIIGGCQVEPRGAGPGFIAVDDDKYVPGLTAFAETIHNQGVKVVAQLYHAGAYAVSSKAVSSSAVQSNLTRMVPKELSIEEIKVVQESHAIAAERIRKAGFDGVELLGSAGYLINQFLSLKTNKRTDEYGGSLENRLRYPLELIKLVKERVGKDIIVGMRVAGDDFVPGSNTYKDSPVFAKHYYEAGIDYINVTGGWHETRVPQIPMMVPQGAYAYLAENIKNQVGVPVFSSNRMNDPIVAEQVLRDGKADAICFGRALIADPYLPQKTKENRLWDIRKCIGCNQGCFDKIFSGKSVECMRNYLVSREGTVSLEEKTRNPMKVLVIGSGPAGLEAARVASILGHDVQIVEKNNNIGGQMHVAAVPKGRTDIKDMIDYYWEQINHLGIDLKLNFEATPESINRINPDAVIFATGVKYSIPNISGIDGSQGSNICVANAALSGDYPIGKNVVVIGGGSTGIETAIWAAELGAVSNEVAHFLSFYDLIDRDEIFSKWLKGNRNVTIIEALPKLASNVGRTTRGFLIGIAKKLGISTITSAKITQFKKDSIEFTIEGKDKAEYLSGIDTFILATGVKSNTDLYDKVKESNPSYKIYMIGDSKEPRTFMEAIHEGFQTAYNLDK